MITSDMVITSATDSPQRGPARGGPGAATLLPFVGIAPAAHPRSRLMRYVSYDVLSRVLSFLPCGDLLDLRRACSATDAFVCDVALPLVAEELMALVVAIPEDVRLRLDVDMAAKSREVLMHQNLLEAP